MAGINRRDFFKMIGVTGAAAGCDARVPTEELLPYVIQPDEITPGVATLYATTCGECAAGCGAVATAREGRLIQLEGNDDNPVGGGGICARGIAGVQGTYDPDGLRGPARSGAGGAHEDATWDDALSAVSGAVKAARRGGVRWLGQYRNGSLGALIGDVLGAAGGRPVHWEPLGYEALAAATRLAFGVDGLPRYSFGGAHTIVSFGAEFLHTWLSPVAHAKDWKRARDPSSGHVAEFVSISSRVGNSDSRADTWLSIAPGSEAAVARALAKLVADENGSVAAAGWLAGVKPAAAAKAAGLEPGKLEALAKKLKKNPSVIFPGGTTAAGAGATDLALATLVLNAVCGNLGSTVLVGAGHDLGDVGSFSDAAKLLADCAAGKVEVLFLDGLDPIFSLPSDVDVAGALGAVKTLVVFANHAPEGLPAGAWLLPPGSAYEAWGDSTSVAGAYSLQQPVMLPLHDTRGVGDVLLAVAKAAGLKAPEAGDDDEPRGDKAGESAKAGKGGKGGKAGKAGKGGKGAKAGKGGKAGKGAKANAKDEEGDAPTPPTLGGSPAVASFEAVDFQRYVAGRWRAVYRANATRGERGDFIGWWRDALQRGGFFTEVTQPAVRLRKDLLARRASAATTRCCSSPTPCSTMAGTPTAPGSRRSPPPWRATPGPPGPS